jgi:hypothetical protein
MDPSLQEVRGLRIAVEGCVSLINPVLSLLYIANSSIRAMARCMQSMLPWLRLARFEVGMELIYSLLGETSRYTTTLKHLPRGQRTNRSLRQSEMLPT